MGLHAILFWMFIKKRIFAPIAYCEEEMADLLWVGKGEEQSRKNIYHHRLILKTPDMKKILLVSCIVGAGLLALTSCKTKKLVSEDQPWSVRMAESEMIRNPDAAHLDFVTTKKWNYTNGLVCEAILDLYNKTGDEKLLTYAKSYADSMILDNGEILTYKMSNYNLDHVNPGKFIFQLYDITKDPKYKTVLDTLRSQLSSQPRTQAGGFWHKKIYPNQMWLDGIYMGDVFYAQYVNRFGDSTEYADIINQFKLAADKTYDPSNGLLRHAWNEDKAQKWADPVTGQAPHAWGRAMGWYAMAIVDALDYIPENTPQRDTMITILQNMGEALLKIQDPETGGWYQVLDLSGEHGNYIETTCTAMFSYAFLKGARNGYLDAKFVDAGKKAYDGLIKNFVTVDDQGLVSLTKCCAVAGLGGNPYRDGSYEYYIGEEIRDNDPKGVGPFIMASLEMEELQK